MGNFTPPEPDPEIDTPNDDGTIDENDSPGQEPDVIPE